MQLTANFTLEEFTRSTTADRLGIDNTPNAIEINNIRLLCVQILQPARSALGPIQISSGFRSAALNAAVGGVPDSAHRLGFSADVVPVNVGTFDLAKWVKNNTSFDQVILEFGTLQNPNWIHISADPRSRMNVLQAFGNPTQYVSVNI
jgi:Peptidase M15